MSTIMCVMRVIMYVAERLFVAGDPDGLFRVFTRDIGYELIK